MSAHDVTLFGDQVAASRLGARFAAMDAGALLRLSIRDLFPGRIALVSSFGADSAVLLHMVAQVDPATPVVFVDTGFLFPETLDYRDELVRLLGLTDVRAVQPSEEDLATLDPAWITGRKRFQRGTRAALPLFEAEGERVKINPLAGWDASELLRYLDRHALPRHRMVARGYPSIGCIPCTSPVKPGEDARAGRWRGKGKTECGIHLGILSAGQDI